MTEYSSQIQHNTSAQLQTCHQNLSQHKQHQRQRTLFPSNKLTTRRQSTLFLQSQTETAYSNFKSTNLAAQYHLASALYFYFRKTPAPSHYAKQHNLR